MLRGERALFLPYWIVLLAVALLWHGILWWQARRYRRALRMEVEPWPWSWTARRCETDRGIPSRQKGDSPMNQSPHQVKEVRPWQQHHHDADKFDGG